MATSKGILRTVFAKAVTVKDGKMSTCLLSSIRASLCAPLPSASAVGYSTDCVRRRRLRPPKTEELAGFGTDARSGYAKAMQAANGVLSIFIALSLSMEHVAWLQNAAIYHGERQILTDVNMSLSKSEFVYLIGKTGSGKSSLLKTLWGEIPLQKGKGKVAGTDLTQLTQDSVRALRRKLGIVFQEFYLFDDWTVWDNLQFVLEATDWSDAGLRGQRIQQVLKDVGLSNTEQNIAGRLSGGEQQRLVIARAILNTPEIIIADEPTGNLDPDTSVEILRLLRSLAVQYNTAIFMATHAYAMIDRFPGRVYKCEGGKVDELD